MQRGAGGVLYCWNRTELWRFSKEFMPPWVFSHLGCVRDTNINAWFDGFWSNTKLGIFVKWKENDTWFSHFFRNKYLKSVAVICMYSAPLSQYFVELFWVWLYQILCIWRCFFFAKYLELRQIEGSMSEQPFEGFATNYQLDLCLDFNLDLNWTIGVAIAACLRSFFCWRVNLNPSLHPLFLPGLSSINLGQSYSLCQFSFPAQ